MWLSRNRILDTRVLHQLMGDSNKVSLVKTLLTESNGVLRSYHLGGAPSQDIVTAHAWLVDQVIKAIWEHHAPSTEKGRSVALIAVGGYGRSELHPGSDIDLLVLFQKAPTKTQRRNTESLIRTLWDIGLTIGHSVRTLRDCTSQSRNDVTVMTNLLESRVLAGDAELLSQLKLRTGIDMMWPAVKYLEAKIDEQSARHLRYDDTAYNLEPQIKEGPGGLRDLQTIGWVAHRVLNQQGIRYLISYNYLTEHEYRELVRGRNFLWKIRNALHFASGRAEDRLLFDYQREIAQQFGYKDTTTLAVEKFMKRYYRTAGEIRLLNTTVLQQLQAVAKPKSKGRNNKATDLNRRFYMKNGLIEIRDSTVFQTSPFALLEVFLLLQQHPNLKGIGVVTIRSIRENLFRIDSEFRQDLQCRSLFMEILKAPLGQTRALRQMNAYGILGAYIPQFGRIIGQMQHDLFHVYTVDAHLLFVVRNLRRLEMSVHDNEYPAESRLMRTISKRHRLFIAALFHDISKGQGGDHSKLGESETFRFCRKHAMSDYDCHFVSWLVRHHLTMSWIAQREDTSDVGVIDDFARLVGDQEHLDNLYLLTVADIRGTSPHVWNDWKAKLLSDLYNLTAQALRRDVGSPLLPSERIEDLKIESLTYLKDSPIKQEMAESVWSVMEDEYFLRNSPAAIAWHTRLLSSASIASLPIVDTIDNSESGTTEVFVCAPDSEHLLCNVTAGFDRENLNIVDARVHRTSSGLVVMIFVVLNIGRNKSTKPGLNTAKQALRAQIINPKPGKDPQQTRLSRSLQHFPIDTKVTFPKPKDQNKTIMVVIAQDRPGLLHQVARAFIECHTHLLSAKISTFGERAEDIFYITDRDGKPINNPEERNKIAETVCAALPS